MSLRCENRTSRVVSLRVCSPLALREFLFLQGTITLAIISNQRADRPPILPSLKLSGWLGELIGDRFVDFQANPKGSVTFLARSSQKFGGPCSGAGGFREGMNV